MPMTIKDDREEIDVSLVARLVAEQFPQWSDLPIARVEPGGWDNCTFRLGSKMCVRLPSAERYATQVAKEHAWLPRIAPSLHVRIPKPLARGLPGAGYPWDWSIYEWIDGEPASLGRIADLKRFAADLGGFLCELHQIDSTGGPPPGPHNFFRGGSLQTYDVETRLAINVVSELVDANAATDAWNEALASRWEQYPVWVHGDVSAGNLLVTHGRLSAVIDFGSCGVGDPACDLVMAWTFFDEDARSAFREALPISNDTWARARGWALWKAMITIAKRESDATASEEALRVVARIACGRS